MTSAFVVIVVVIVILVTSATAAVVGIVVGFLSVARQLGVNASFTVKQTQIFFRTDFFGFHFFFIQRALIALAVTSR